MCEKCETLREKFARKFGEKMELNLLYVLRDKFREDSEVLCHDPHNPDDGYVDLVQRMEEYLCSGLKDTWFEVQAEVARENRWDIIKKKEGKK